MEANPRPEPRFSEDRHWWWNGSQWVPASQAPVRTSAWRRWAQSLFPTNHRSWPWTAAVALGAALLLAGYDLVTGWQVRNLGPAWVVFLGLVALALYIWIGLLVASGQDRRRILAGGGSLPDSVGLAARRIRRSSLFAIGLSFLMFANCSAPVSSGTQFNTTSGVIADPSQFWSLAALVMLPLLVSLAFPSGLATAAQQLAGKGRLHAAMRAASLGIWSAGLIALVALVTTGVAIWAISYCDFGVHPGACAAGIGGLMNPTAIASLLVTVPYLAAMRRVLSVAGT